MAGRDAKTRKCQADLDGAALSDEVVHRCTYVERHVISVEQMHLGGLEMEVRDRYRRCHLGTALERDTGRLNVFGEESGCGRTRAGPAAMFEYVGCDGIQ